MSDWSSDVCSSDLAFGSLARQRESFLLPERVEPRVHRRPRPPVLLRPARRSGGAGGAVDDRGPYDVLFGGTDHSPPDAAVLAHPNLIHTQVGTKLLNRLMICGPTYYL